MANQAVAFLIEGIVVDAVQEQMRSQLDPRQAMRWLVVAVDAAASQMIDTEVEADQPLPPTVRVPAELVAGDDVHIGDRVHFKAELAAVAIVDPQLGQPSQGSQALTEAMVARSQRWSRKVLTRGRRRFDQLGEDFAAGRLTFAAWLKAQRQLVIDPSLAKLQNALQSDELARNQLAKPQAASMMAVVDDFWEFAVTAGAQPREALGTVASTSKYQLRRIDAAAVAKRWQTLLAEAKAWQQAHPDGVSATTR